MKTALLICVAALSAAVAVSQPTKSIADILQQSDNKDRFSTLVQATQVAGILENLSKGGPMTLFSPTNDAFKKLPEGTLAKLLANPADLKKILLSHVVTSAITMSNLKDGSLTAFDGTTLKLVTGDDKAVTVNGAKILLPSTPEMSVASNGVVYAIDRVILPS